MSKIEVTIKKRQFLKEFIQLYESFPCLWSIKSKQYHDRELRSRAYKVLIKKMQEIQPNADRPVVVKKINCLRCNVRKEKKKSLSYLKAGKVYKPRLWYYSLFNFLDGMNRRSRTNSEELQAMETIKVEDKTNDPLNWQCEIENETNEAGNFSHDEVMVTEEQACQPTYELEPLIYSDPGPSKKNAGNYEAFGVTSHGKSFEDKHDVFGKNVAMKLRHVSSISDTQRIMAEKIINEALYMAEMGLLTLEHCKVLK